MSKIQIARSLLEPLIRATFPEYAGKTCYVEVRETISFHDLNWSGGSRNQYRACTIDGKPTGSLDKFNQAAPWNNPAEGAKAQIPPGLVVVQHCLFCGKDLGLTFSYNAADFPHNLLPAKIELTDLEKKALDIIGGIKSGYRPAEFAGAGLGTYGPQNPTVLSLKAKGLCSVSGGKAVALTVEGRNARRG